jgi:FkbH-like protein
LKLRARHGGSSEIGSVPADFGYLTPMIVLVGQCGLERLATALRSAGERVHVLPATHPEAIAALAPELVYADLFDGGWLQAVWHAHLSGRRPPSLAPARAALQACAALPVVFRGVRDFPAGTEGPGVAEPIPSITAARRLLRGHRTVDVQGLWHRHGILDDGVRFGVGHGEPELGELGCSRLDGRSAAAVEAEAVLAWLDARRGKLCKAVVVDLDDTLIHGEIAAPDFTGRNPAWGGKLRAAEAWWHAPRGIHEALLLARRRGVALALCSRNDPAVVAERFRVLPALRGRLLDLDAFDALAIGFGAKSAACRQVADRLGIGLDSVAFLDDSEAERSEVATNAPEVLLLPSPGPGAREVLAGGRGFVPWAQTEAASQRPGSYRSRAAVVDAGAAGEAALVAFLQGMNIELAVRLALPEEHPRITELLARSHQVRLTGASAPTAGATVYVAACRDRLADHGLVGVAWVEGGVGQRRVGELAMSCRVLPHRVASSFLAQVLASEPGAAVQRVDTGQNGATVNLLEEATAGIAGWVRLSAGIAPRPC